MDHSIRPLRPGEKPSCPVCYKKTESECSHIECPNRVRVTAQMPQGEGVEDLGFGRAFSNPMYGRYSE